MNIPITAKQAEKFKIGFNQTSDGTNRKKRRKFAKTVKEGIEKFDQKDHICTKVQFHPRFKNGKTLVVQRINFMTEEGPKFRVIKQLQN